MTKQHETCVLFCLCSKACGCDRYASDEKQRDNVRIGGTIVITPFFINRSHSFATHQHSNRQFLTWFINWTFSYIHRRTLDTSYRCRGSKASGISLQQTRFNRKTNIDDKISLRNFPKHCLCVLSRVRTLRFHRRYGYGRSRWTPSGLRFALADE